MKYLSLFVLLHSTNFIDKLKFNHLKKYLNKLNLQIFFSLQKHKVGQLSKRRECFVGLFVLLY